MHPGFRPQAVELEGQLMAASEKPSAAKGGAEPKPEDFFPIVDGRIYRYDFQSPEWPFNTLMTQKPKSVKTAGGKTTADWEETWPDPDDTDNWPAVRGWKVELSSEGVKERWPNADLEYWVIRAPLREGATWEREDGTVFTIDSLKEKVTVPAGEYAGCLLVTYENEGIGTGELFYAKGVGMVKSSQRGEWTPHDYALSSMTQGPSGEPPLAARKAVEPRIMAVKGKK